MIVGKFSRVDLSPVFDRIGQFGVGDNAEEYFFRLIGAYIAAKQIEKILVIRPQEFDLAVLVTYPDDLSSICVVSFGDEISFLKSLGISSKQSDDTVLAEYKDFKVTQGMVNFQKRAANLAGDNTNIEASDYTKDAIIDRLLIGRMLVEEAESRGVAATKAEMEDNLSSLKASYNDYPEVKKQVDEYCSGAGLSIDEYWTQVYDQSYDQISRTNLRILLGKDFCKETGYDGSVDDALMTDEFDQYYNDHRAQLLKEHQSDVKYYS